MAVDLVEVRSHQGVLLPDGQRAGLPLEKWSLPDTLTADQAFFDFSMLATHLQLHYASSPHRRNTDPPRRGRYHAGAIAARYIPTS